MESRGHLGSRARGCPSGAELRSPNWMALRGSEEQRVHWDTRTTTRGAEAAADFAVATAAVTRCHVLGEVLLEDAHHLGWDIDCPPAVPLWCLEKHLSAAEFHQLPPTLIVLCCKSTRCRRNPASSPMRSEHHAPTMTMALYGGSSVSMIRNTSSGMTTGRSIGASLPAPRMWHGFTLIFSSSRATLRMQRSNRYAFSG